MKKSILVFCVIFGLSSSAQVNTLHESIYFGLGKTSLNKQQKKQLDNVVELLEKSDKYAGEVKGYTCNIGSNSINKLVSNLRALNVYNYLVDKGVKREYFTYQGFGSKNPKASNKTEKGRAQNRRADVEVILSLLDAESDTKNEDEYAGIKDAVKNQKNGSGTENPGISSTENSSSTIPSKFLPAVELGPEFVSGKMPVQGDKRIKSTNGIVLDIDRNSLITSSKEPIELDFKDYTQNFDIIKKAITTNGGVCSNYSILGAFSTNFSQEYQELAINPSKPVIVSIPSEFFPDVKLYSNHKNWQLDTINQMTYNYEKKAYDVLVKDNSKMIGILKPNPDTIYYLKIKIKGLAPENIKPYVVYDNCLMSMCCRQEGKWFIVPISEKSNSYNIRSMYIDYSSKNPEFYSLNYDIKNLDLTKLKRIKDGNVVIYKYPEKLRVTTGKLLKSSLCETSAEVELK